METFWPVFKKHTLSRLILMLLHDSVVNLEPLSGQFGALWGHFRVPWVHFQVTLAQVGAKLTLSRPEADLNLVQDGFRFAKIAPRIASKVCRGALWEHFGVTLASLWSTLGRLEGHFGSTLRSLWVSSASFWATVASV